MAVKQPEDRKPKTVEPSSLLEIEVRGVAATVSRDVMDDWEFLGALGDLGSDFSKAPGVLKQLVGAVAYKQLLDTIRDENGRVSITAGSELFQEVFNALQEAQSGPNS